MSMQSIRPPVKHTENSPINSYSHSLPIDIDWPFPKPNNSKMVLKDEKSSRRHPITFNPFFSVPLPPSNTLETLSNSPFHPLSTHPPNPQPPTPTPTPSPPILPPPPLEASPLLRPILLTMWMTVVHHTTTTHLVGGQPKRQTCPKPPEPTNPPVSNQSIPQYSSHITHFTHLQPPHVVGNPFPKGKYALFCNWCENRCPQNRVRNFLARIGL